jgi:hypothetical protein
MCPGPALPRDLLWRALQRSLDTRTASAEQQSGWLFREPAGLAANARVLPPTARAVIDSKGA